MHLPTPFGVRRVGVLDPDALAEALWLSRPRARFVPLRPAHAVVLEVGRGDPASLSIVIGIGDAEGRLYLHYTDLCLQTEDIELLVEVVVLRIDPEDPVFRIMRAVDGDLSHACEPAFW